MLTSTPWLGLAPHGSAEQIQTFRSQAYHTTFSARHHTPLYRRKTPFHQVAVVLTSLAEGLDLSVAERVFGYRQATITTWLTRAGEYAQTLHERSFCHLRLSHLQFDELCTRLRRLPKGAVASNRSLHEASSRASSGSTHTKCGAHGHPLPAATLGSWLPLALHQ